MNPIRQYKRRDVVQLAARIARLRASGVRGPRGLTGPIGESGTNGTNGTDGVNGTNGTNGIDGTNGTNGTNGANGREDYKSLTGTLTLAQFLALETTPIEILAPVPGFSCFVRFVMFQINYGGVPFTGTRVRLLAFSPNLSPVCTVSPSTIATVAANSFTSNSAVNPTSLMLTGQVDPARDAGLCFTVSTGTNLGGGTGSTFPYRVLYTLVPNWPV